ncbi:class I SAM-dependent methyltransferase [Paenibacillus cremeus]|uniref:Class I SAM-dependent methyltransferase n=1 Tax=Paenibacillus cremeus TaxID=2163881 RepID=A0A559K971_9BACL|nr:class I SAM-dependent methyltransferase [Paenibacillus cremeus]TVY08678.1 class I SAM-dependent methyltransferase [Paenibacillus cremeus]
MTTGSRWFQQHYDRLMAPLERRRFGQIRAELLSHAHGEVLEIGAGTGINFPLYRDSNVVQVTAIEPSERMREQARPRAQQARVPVTLIEGSAEQLPWEAGTFDTIVGTLVLCTIPDPAQAVREMLRVGRPGGTLLLFEHVRLEHPFWGRLQDVLTPLWSKACDGCQLNRNTVQLLRAEGGFEPLRIERHLGGVFLALEAEIPLLKQS